MQKALIFLALLISSTLFTGATFSDLSISHTNRDAILFLQTRGIISGYADGTFRPDSQINRAEFTTMVIGSLYGHNLTDKSCFPDVQAGQWYAKYICKAKDLGIVNGYPDGHFAPSNAINYVEALAISLNSRAVITRAPERGEDWYIGLSEYAEIANLRPGNITSAGKLLSRGDFAEINYRLILIQESNADRFGSTLAAISNTPQTSLTQDEKCMQDCILIKSGSDCAKVCLDENKIETPQTSIIKEEECLQDCLKAGEEGKDCSKECSGTSVTKTTPITTTPPVTTTTFTASKNPKQIEVFLNQEKGNVQGILGLTEPPNSDKFKVTPQTNKYKNIGISWVALNDDFLALQEILIDNSKSANDKSNYDFRKIDKAINEIIKSGGKPIFMLTHDINCFKECGDSYPRKLGLGYKPDDYDKWVAVVINVMKHFNGMFEVEKQARNYKKGDVTHFVVWDEPGDLVDKNDQGVTGNLVCGYPCDTTKCDSCVYQGATWTGNFDDFWKLYKKLADAVDADSDLNNVVKLSPPAHFWMGDLGFTGETSFLKKIVENKTRMDFFVYDNYAQNFWAFVNGDDGIKNYNNIKNTLETKYGYNNVEIYITAMGINTGSIASSGGGWEALLGYCENNYGTNFCSTGKEFNYETHYGAALIASDLIYTENSGVKSFVWELPIGASPLMPLATIVIFDVDAKLTYEGLAYKIFSKMLKFDGRSAIKVKSTGSEEFYGGAIRTLDNTLAGYKTEDIVQVLSAKSKDKTKISVLLSHWNLNPKESRYDSYNIKIKDALDGTYNYKIYIIDKDHTYPDRCGKCPWWDEDFKNMMPQETKNEMTRMEARCPELSAIYCPARSNDKSISYDAENELGIAKEGTISSSNGVINLQILDVQSSAVHLIEFSK